MPQASIRPPYFPIIYVRGYAGREAEVEDTVADPYMGFNLGATKVRQRWTGDIRRHYFESPVVRLMKDFQYTDVYHAGAELPDDVEVGPRSLFIYRYYDAASRDLGTGRRGEIEEYAAGLSDLILKVRDRVCGDRPADLAAFRVYLVAHSMGGLICRCFLQNPGVGTDEARGLVDKVYTYATPHNGIDLKLIGNVPGLISRNNSDNFNRKRMRDYLALDGGDGNASSLGGRFDPGRFFCLVGTDHRDYEAAMGLSKRLVGPMSDGLVRIENAVVWGPWPQGPQAARLHAPRAFVHRSHSGHYGIVNSEEGYQNLTRFLFGDVRVDGVLEVSEISLPPQLQRAKEKGKEIRASYHFEAVLRVRGAGWDLHRRTVDEGSSVFRSYDEMLKPAPGKKPRHPHLFSAFLSARSRVNRRRASLGFSLDLRVLVPQYEVDRKAWFDHHYDGGYLYREKLNLEAIPPKQDGEEWRLRFGLDSRTPNRATRDAAAAREDGRLVFRIPVEQKSRPGLTGQLVLRTRPWN